MSKLETIKQQVRELNDAERALLVDWLTEDEIDEAAWDAECLRIGRERIRNIEEGKARTISASELKQRLRDRYGYEF